MPRVLLLATAGLLAGTGMASAAPSSQAASAMPSAQPAHASASPSTHASPTAHHLAPSAPGPALTHPATSDPACTVGELCLWTTESYSGTTQHYDLRTANPEDCIPLPEGFEGHSFVNRLTRDVTIYQSEECTTEGDFTTYPGGGTYVPQSPFVVRAIKIWN
ncbi:peptidase inhibitor family I36 protein [Amycolatopsis carbonis]|uniref:Peptidase inhibitor family I36 protein n=1 Tax=Amycolatopsis carbonis TaxID=715471 RepID=A0A9Y2IRB4_9PSEU|nr:peptidase inhibitor family I36 protein [Amycolatopsis sp. 2-15]WIX83986.1 peptidase inhibitor family I36 protein [Amycolatopsis sp. 2-15]